MEELLLDTCAFLWLGMGGGRLSDAAKRRIGVASHLYVSPITAWEIMRKFRDGGIDLPEEPELFMERVCGYFLIDELPLTREIMFNAASLPMIHKDPADRFIIATALSKGLTIITGDRRFPEYGVSVIE